MTFQQVLALPPSEREQLGQAIFDSLSGQPLNDVERAWVDEAEKRLEEMRNGTVAGLSEDAVVGGIKREMGWQD